MPVMFDADNNAFVLMRDLTRSQSIETSHRPKDTKEKSSAKQLKRKLDHSIDNDTDNDEDNDNNSLQPAQPPPKRVKKTIDSRQQELRTITFHPPNNVYRSRRSPSPAFPANFGQPAMDEDDEASIGEGQIDVEEGSIESEQRSTNSRGKDPAYLLEQVR